MKRLVFSGILLTVLAATGLGGYWAGHRGIGLPVLPVVEALAVLGAGPGTAEATAASSGPDSATGPVIYYRDPDGRPLYSATPRHTDDGRAFIAVQASEDVSLDFAPDTDDAIAAATPAADGAAEPRQILYYRNPMGLPDTSPVPKKDSMGMDYIPVYADEISGGSAVRIAPGRLQQTGVKTELAVRQPVRRPVLVPGTVEFDERLVVVVAMRTDAFVEEIADVTTGELIGAGEPLVRLYSPEITAAAAQYVTELKVDNGSARAGGARQRLENLGVPAETIEEIERTRKAPLAVTLTAPRAGIVLERNAVDGMMAAAGEVLFRLADTRKVWVLAEVPEYELGLIRVGAPATVRVRSYPDLRFEGQLSVIYPQVGMETRTARVRIEISNPDGLLLPNMYADVEIATGDGEPVIAVSDSAVIDSGTHQVVILDRGEGRFEPREVETGMRGGGMIEIRDGVAEGDRVVVSANFLIDAESNLRAALNALTASEVRP